MGISIQAKLLAQNLLLVFNVTVIIAYPKPPSIYPEWNTTSPLNLTNPMTIPYNALNSLLDVDGTQKIAYEHWLDVISTRKTHNITEENVMVRILA